MTTSPLRVLLVDDHAVVRRGLREIIEEFFSGAEFGEASNGQECVAHVSAGPWDVVILDISLPGRGGLDVLKDIRRLQPHVPVLVLSVYPEEQYAVRVLRAGASGYMTKESAPNDVVGAIRKVIAGGKYVSATLAERLVSELGSPAPQQQHERLSDREFEILLMIASGKRVSDIARQLNLSVKTVSTYRNRILQKMDMATNSDLTRYVVTNGLFDAAGGKV